MVRTGKEAHSEEADRLGRAGTRPGWRVAEGPVGPRRTRPVDRGDDCGRVVGPRCCAPRSGFVPTDEVRAANPGFGLRTAGVIARWERPGRHDILSGGIGTFVVGVR